MVLNYIEMKQATIIISIQLDASNDKEVVQAINFINQSLSRDADINYNAQLFNPVLDTLLIEDI